jgi:23S rRNA (adenine-N6)-dimethyltransferase
VAALDVAFHVHLSFSSTRAIARLLGQGGTMVRPRNLYERRPELSQHFIRPETARRMVTRVPRREGVPVLEIGAGYGTLTAALADEGFHVIAIEKDARLFRALRSRFIGRTNVECHHADFFGHDLPDEPYVVVANVPFGITSSVVRTFLDGPKPPLEAWLIVQGEAAEKFAGVPRETLFSLQHRPWFDIGIAMRLSRDAFEPRPRVSAALLHIARRERPLITAREAAPYRAFVQTAFGAADMRAALRRYMTRRQFVRLAREVGFPVGARSPELAFDQWLRVFRFVPRPPTHISLPRSACAEIAPCTCHRSSSPARPPTRGSLTTRARRRLPGSTGSSSATT